MRTILFLIRKEFKQIFRNKGLLPIIIMMPIIQLLILTQAADYEIKKIDFSILDMDRSSASRELILKFSETPKFNLVDSYESYKEADRALQLDRANLVLVIQADFEKNLVSKKSADLQLLLDAVNASAAGIINGYAQQIINDFAGNNRFINFELLSAERKMILVKPRFWFNPEMNYITFMVPGILVLLVTMIGLFITAMNIAREKEVGTIEQLNVTPLKKVHFIAGKLIPMWIIGLMEMAIGLIIGYFVFNVPMLGSLITVFIFSAIYLIIMLALGLIISTQSDTQQQAMFVAYFFNMIFVFLSGLFTPIDSMPFWAKGLTKLVPISYFMEVMRNVLLKGTAFHELLGSFWILSAFAAGTLAIAVWQYRKVS